MAIAEEDLSYAQYVCEYSSGHFANARNHVEKSIQILKDLVPTNHLLLSSAKRVKALILEEIALDSSIQPDNTGKKHIYNLFLFISFKVKFLDNTRLLLESEELHKNALELSLETFGEINVQTAKHYGNLGRLYQSMLKFRVRFLILLFLNVFLIIFCPNRKRRQCTKKQ